ncbi:DMT family transporter [Desulfohalovibrio reitneri]|uniref:DMT family transporter n=1 Tax=Desulfohalovibrio reitneri TaxID=1307759 RepID=UPI0004A6EE12|nr:DMT family transporter [Desulfohalovibrio reitneri]
MPRPFSAIGPGVRLMVVSAFWFSLGTACVKAVGEQVALMQIVMARGLISALICIPLMRRAGVHPMGINRRLLLLRGGLGFGAMSLSFYAILHLPLADAVTLFYLHPVFAALLSMCMGREAFSKRTGLSLLLGLAGVVVIARPAFLFGAEAALPLWPLLAALASSFFAGTVKVILHELGRTEHPLGPTFYVSLMSAALAGAASIPVWVWPDVWGVALLLGIGALATVSQYTMTRALALEPAGRVSVAGYTQVVFAGVWGVLFFAEVVGAPFFLGAGLILGGSLLAGRRGVKQKEPGQFAP